MASKSRFLKTEFSRFSKTTTTLQNSPTIVVLQVTESMERDWSLLTARAKKRKEYVMEVACLVLINKGIIGFLLRPYSARWFPGLVCLCACACQCVFGHSGVDCCSTSFRLCSVIVYDCVCIWLSACMFVVVVVVRVIVDVVHNLLCYIFVLVSYLSMYVRVHVCVSICVSACNYALWLCSPNYIRNVLSEREFFSVFICRMFRVLGVLHIQLFVYMQLCVFECVCVCANCKFY